MAEVPGSMLTGVRIYLICFHVVMPLMLLSPILCVCENIYYQSTRNRIASQVHAHREKHLMGRIVALVHTFPCGCACVSVWRYTKVSTHVRATNMRRFCLLFNSINFHKLLLQEIDSTLASLNNRVYPRCLS